MRVAGCRAPSVVVSMAGRGSNRRETAALALENTHTRHNRHNPVHVHLPSGCQQQNAELDYAPSAECSAWRRNVASDR
jgi:hypothetical protein